MNKLPPHHRVALAAYGAAIALVVIDQLQAIPAAIAAGVGGYAMLKPQPGEEPEAHADAHPGAVAAKH